MRARTPADIAKFAEHLHVDHLPHTVILDCTADESVARSTTRTGSRPASTW